MPWVGGAFRRLEERVNEVELRFLVRPEFVDALDPHEVPPCGPGQFTTTPSGTEFYGRGYIEVPKCCDNGACASGACAAPAAGFEAYTPAATTPGSYPAMPIHRSAPNSPPNPYLGNNRSRHTGVVPASTRSAEPGLIGPVGYDVLKN